MTNHLSAFRDLHRGPLLLLPNAWDAMSARMMEQAGFRAVGTSSAAVAWSLGYGDGEEMPFEELAFVASRMLSVLTVPLTVDMESGFASDPEMIAANAAALARLGVAGINLEDSLKDHDGVLRTLQDQEAVIRAIRERLSKEGLDLFINARTDLYWMGVGAEDRRRADTIDRCNAYVAAGADGVFVPGLTNDGNHAEGLTDFGTIEALAQAVDAPLNILAFPVEDLLPRLEAAGVARVSTGSGAYRRVAADIGHLCRSMRSDPGLDHMFDDPLSYPALQSLMTGEA